MSDKPKVEVQSQGGLLAEFDGVYVQITYYGNIRIWGANDQDLPWNNKGFEHKEKLRKVLVCIKALEKEGK